MEAAMKLLKTITNKCAFMMLFAFLVSEVQCFQLPSTTRSNRWVTPRFSSKNDIVELDRVESNIRRKMMETSILFGFASFVPSIADASEETVSPDVVAKAFAKVRFELEDAAGGVSTMQTLIDDQNWESLLEFTKTYDQVLRKAKMGSAKKLLPKERQDAATLASNAVTFDLIGINRASRKGQESVELANKYLNELRSDVKLLLELQKTIQ